MRNKKEIRISAMLRSGHHAIIHWVANQFDGYVLHRNDTMECALRKKKTSNTEWGAKKSIRDCYIINFEDVWPNKIGELYEENKKLLTSGKSYQIYNLFVIRDPLNMFASRKKLAEKLDRKDRTVNRTGGVGWFDDRAVLLWKEYANRYLNPEKDDVWVNFNRWYQDKEYRKEISLALGIDFSDKGLNIVPPQGYGSSFNGQAFDSEAQFMPVLERYKSMSGDQEYLQIFKDEELILLYEKIWGQIPKELK